MSYGIKTGKAPPPWDIAPSLGAHQQIVSGGNPLVTHYSYVPATTIPVNSAAGELVPRAVNSADKD